jgi:hypothetical protein
MTYNSGYDLSSQPLPYRQGMYIFDRINHKAGPASQDEDDRCLIQEKLTYSLT